MGGPLRKRSGWRGRQRRGIGKDLDCPWGPRRAQGCTKRATRAIPGQGTLHNGMPVRTRGPLPNGRAVEKKDRGLRSEETLPGDDHAAALGGMQREGIGVGDEPRVCGAAHALVVMVVMLVRLGGALAAFLVRVERSIIVRVVVITGELFRGWTAVTGEGRLAIWQGEAGTVIGTVAGYFMAARHGLGEGQATHDEQEKERFADRTHEIFICFDRKRDKGIPDGGSGWPARARGGCKNCGPHDPPRALMRVRWSRRRA